VRNTAFLGRRLATAALLHRDHGGGDGDDEQGRQVPGFCQGCPFRSPWAWVGVCTASANPVFPQLNMPEVLARVGLVLRWPVDAMRAAAGPRLPAPPASERPERDAPD
jgi:hypothetical protein